MKEVLYEVRCLKSTEDMILALTGQLLKLDNCLNCPASARIMSSVDFKHRTSYNTSFIYIMSWLSVRLSSTHALF